METELLKPDKEGLLRASKLIKEGKTVVFPTETVYGLGADALNSDAVKSIFTAKGRPSDNPLIVHIEDMSALFNIVSEIPEKAKILMDKFWPGPLTIILNKKDSVPSETSGGLNTVGVRMPESKIARELIRLSGCPIAAPSANISGKPSPTNFKDVCSDMMGRVSAIIEGEPSKIGVESTVIDLTTDVPTIYRPGGVTLEMIRDAIGEAEYASSLTDDAPKSPGMKYKHYSPSAKVYILKGNLHQVEKFIKSRLIIGKSAGLLCFDEFIPHIDRDITTISLGSKEKPEDAANRLFSALRKCDELSLDELYAPPVIDDGLWKAVKNRLYRAAGETVIDLSSFKNVLFVCTGNTCRSPMAERIYNFLNNGLSSSAGIFAEVGAPMSENSAYALELLGIDNKNHRAKLVSPEILDSFRLILTMTKSQKDFISSMGAKNAFTLPEYVGEDGEIPDPFGRSRDDYVNCAKELLRLIRKIKL